jgi:protein PhnA
MSEESQECPKCKSPYIYPDGNLWICPECFHEWTLSSSNIEENTPTFKDVNGNELHDGDAVTTTKDLKLGKSTIKAGTKVKGIKLLDDPVNGHDILCKANEHGTIYLKCSVVKKA